MSDIQYTANTNKFIASEFGDEMILMNLESGDYVNLNQVSADIWRKAESSKITMEDLINFLLEEYDVSQEICTKETSECIQQMTEKDLLLKVA